MKLLIILTACLITVTNANFLDDLLKPLKALGEGLSATVKQVVPYTQQVGKQLLKDTATTALSSIGKGLTSKTCSSSRAFSPFTMMHWYNNVSFRC